MSGDPEGIVWFSRATLKTKSFNADDAKSFYNHILIDVITNSTPGYSQKEDYEKQTRAEFQYLGGSAGYRFQNMSCMYGTDPKNIARIEKVSGDDKCDMSKDKMAAFVPIPVPTKEERYLWIDLTYPVRGVYFPVCYKANVECAHMCKYARLDFKARQIILPFARAYDPALFPSTGSSSSEIQTVEKDVQGLLTSKTATSSTASKPFIPTDDAKSTDATVIEDVAWRDWPIIDGLNNPSTKPTTTTSTDPKTGKQVPNAILKGTKTFTMDHQMGFGYNPAITLRLDVQELCKILPIPRSLRIYQPIGTLTGDISEPKKFTPIDLYRHNLVVIFGWKDITLAPSNLNIGQSWLRPADVVDFLSYCKNELGLNLQYADGPEDPTKQLQETVQQAVQAGLGAIPVFGPVLACAEQMAYQALTDPKYFEKPQNVGQEVAKTMMDSSEDFAKYLAKFSKAIL